MEQCNTSWYVETGGSEKGRVVQVAFLRVCQINNCIDDVEQVDSLWEQSLKTGTVFNVEVRYPNTRTHTTSYLHKQSICDLLKVSGF
jgi:hypothetical protein